MRCSAGPFQHGLHDAAIQSFPLRYILSQSLLHLTCTVSPHHEKKSRQREKHDNVTLGRLKVKYELHYCRHTHTQRARTFLAVSQLMILLLELHNPCLQLFHPLSGAHAHLLHDFDQSPKPEHNYN